MSNTPEKAPELCPNAVQAIRNLMASAPASAKYFQCPREWADVLVKRQARQEVFLLELLADTEDAGLKELILELFRELEPRQETLAASLSTRDATKEGE